MDRGSGSTLAPWMSAELPKFRLDTMDIPEVGRIAVLTDPQGAWFAIIKPNPDQK